MENKAFCSSKDHSEINAISYCQKCEIYMCNKCEKIHSEICKNHIPYSLNKDPKNTFTGLCKISNHSSKLVYFCKDHNQLCCGLCITKIKGEGNGQHTDCNLCFIKDIKDEKKSKLGENIKKLEELSKIIDKSIKELKNIFEKINKSKEDIKINIQKIFTTIRNKINEREDELLLEVDKIYEEIFFSEDIIKKGEKLPKNIKESIQQGNLINNEWDENKYGLNCLLNDCINIENNIKEIDIITESINKYNNIKSEIKYDSEKDLNELLELIKNFGVIIIGNLPKITDKFNISQNPLIVNPNNNYTQQKVTMDPYPMKENEKKIYHIIGYSNWNSIRIYNDFESFKNQNYNELKLSIKGCGSNWTIFKNNLYCCTDTNGKKIFKINLKTNKMETEKEINDNNGDAGQWGGYNTVIFISNPQSIYIIYQSNNGNKLVIRELNPDSLEIIKSWETDAKTKSSYGALFMIGKILFGIDKYSASPTKIIYKYDLDKKQSNNINMNFQNIGGYDTSLHYCYNTGQLWTINNGKFYSYDVQL